MKKQYFRATRELIKMAEETMASKDPGERSGVGALVVMFPFCVICDILALPFDIYENFKSKGDK